MYNINTLFCFVDDFCKIYEKMSKNVLIASNKQRIRKTTMSLSEIITIAILFHISPIRNFKCFYLYYLQKRHGKDFKKFISYNRFVELMPRIILPLSLLLHALKGEETGTYFIDSTKLQICHNKRISSNRVFKGIAKKGKSSYGWFLGFKLHLVINDKGQIISIKITKGNIDDREPVEELLKNLKGSTYADKGYIKHNLFLKLLAKGLRFIYGIRSNMKNYLMPVKDKILLRKRSLIESSFNILKNQMNLEHTRHRSPLNFIVNILSCLVAYCFKVNKPKIKGWEDKIKIELIPN